MMYYDFKSELIGSIKIYENDSGYNNQRGYCSADSVMNASSVHLYKYAE